MNDYSLHAYESMGLWQIEMRHGTKVPGGEWHSDTLYKGSHVAIDEEDPLVRAVLLLHQVYTDLNGALMGEIDTLADRPAHH